jgi:hypothetical protein
VLKDVLTLRREDGRKVIAAAVEARFGYLSLSLFVLPDSRLV